MSEPAVIESFESKNVSRLLTPSQLLFVGGKHGEKRKNKQFVLDDQQQTLAIENAIFQTLLVVLVVRLTER